jgi:histidinol phosphatase-like enzyme
MILQAQQELNLDLGNSTLISDKASDIQACIAASIRLNMLFAHKQPSGLSGLPYQSITTLHEAVHFMNSIR